MIFIGDWRFSQGRGIERQEPRRSASSPPLAGFVETNTNQPGPETRFTSKLFEMSECFERGLLHNVLHVRLTPNRCPEHKRQGFEMRRNQVCEKILTPTEYLADQSNFLRGACSNRNHSAYSASQGPILTEPKHSIVFV